MKTTDKTTSKTEILRVLAEAGPGKPLAIHEIKAGIPAYSENALATRISELHAEGKVVGRTRRGAPYKEWRLATPAESATLLAQQRAPVTSTGSKIDTDAVIADAMEQGLPIADEETVRSLFKAVDRALVDAVNGRTEPIGKVDLFMLASNFTRRIVEIIEELNGDMTLEDRRGFRLHMLATIERGLLQRLQQ